MCGFPVLCPPLPISGNETAMLAPQLNVAQRAARDAGNLLRRALEEVDVLKVQQKGSNDFVTEVDRAAEKRIINVLQKYYPDYGILAEEGGRSEEHTSELQSLMRISYAV